MANNPMKTLCFLLLSLIVPGSFATESITQQSLEQYIFEINQCFENKDFECLSEKMADDIQLYVETSINSQVMKNELTKKTYLEGMSQGWQQNPNYSYEQTSVKITGISGNTATYVETVTEIVPTAQGTHEMNSESEVLVELVNNRLLTKKVKAKATLKIK